MQYQATANTSMHPASIITILFNRELPKWYSSRKGVTQRLILNSCSSLVYSIYLENNYHIHIINIVPVFLYLL